MRCLQLQIFADHGYSFSSLSFIYPQYLICVQITALLVGRSRDQPPVVSPGIFSVVPSDKTMCPDVDSASENEYQEFLLG